jgi:hypothetical protein
VRRSVHSPDRVSYYCCEVGAVGQILEVVGWSHAPPPAALDASWVVRPSVDRMARSIHPWLCLRSSETEPHFLLEAHSAAVPPKAPVAFETQRRRYSVTGSLLLLQADPWLASSVDSLTECILR